jgi:Domain of unknown function (DUF6265)
VGCHQQDFRLENHAMRRIALAVVLVLANSAATALELPDWLAGHWQGRDGKIVTDEVWLAPAPGLMTSMSRSHGGKAVFFEFVRIEQRGTALYYIAQPRGAAPTEFQAIAADADSLRFENKGHDFPQRIIHERRGSDGLDARIEGEIDGKTRVGR